MIFYLAMKNLKFHLGRHLLSICLMSLGLAMILSILATEDFLRNYATKNLSQIDMVVGAKGSPLQLILANLYHIDNPTGNISYSIVDSLKKESLVKRAVPLSYGDSFANRRICGTDSGLIALYQVKMNSGHFVQNEFEVIISEKLAKLLNLKLKDTFHGNHGEVNSPNESHGEYRIVGIFENTGTAIDQLFICNLETVWDVHHADQKNEITAVLVQFSNPMALFRIPRKINQDSQFMAALPSIEMNRLFSLFGQAFQLLIGLSYLIIFMSLFSITLQISQNLKERKAEFALLQLTGLSRAQITRLLTGEFSVIFGLSLLIAIILSKLLLLYIHLKSAFESKLLETVLTFSPKELIFIGIVFIILVFLILFTYRSLKKINIAKELYD